MAAVFGPILFDIDGLPRLVPRVGDFCHISRGESCSARESVINVDRRSSLKTKVRSRGAAAIGSARPAMFDLAGGVDGGGVGVGVCPQCGVVGGAEHVEQSAVSTKSA